MHKWQDIYEMVKDSLPWVSVLVGLIIGLWVAHYFLLKWHRVTMSERRRNRGLTAMLALTILAFIIFIFTIPIDNEPRGQLLAIAGIALTAVISLSSTTFISNIMAGLMLRTLGNFKPGDFIHVGEESGRVSERGLFHTEIQTEDRDLVTLPNMFLISKPVRVVRSSGTIISAMVSIGYDVPHQKVRECLLKAGKDAELDEPFVRLVDLGDFSVSYRVAGFLNDVNHLLSARSKLHRRMLDAFHEAGVEIVSPTFMNQRRIGEENAVIPMVVSQGEGGAGVSTDEDEERSAEEKMFDKAEQAAMIERLRSDREELIEKIQSLQEEAKKASDEPEKARVEREIEIQQARVESYERMIGFAEEKKSRRE